MPSSGSARCLTTPSFILTSVPTYVGGPFAFAWGCDDSAKRTLDRLSSSRRGRCPSGLRCYTPTVHAAAFVHPPWMTAPLD